MIRGSCLCGAVRFEYAHIFVGSKAPWDEIAGSAPQFEAAVPVAGPDPGA